MRTRHALTLVVALSLPALAATVVRENPPPPSAKPKLEPKKKGSRFVQRRLARPFAGEGTPLIVSATEDVKLRPLGRATFEFEPGEALRSAWPDAQTAWLVKGEKIESGRDLFGSWTVLAEDRRAENGFEALAALDDDQDGFVGPGDSQFAALRLWFDRDGDHRVSPQELQTLGTITRLPTKFEELRRCDVAGNCTVERAQLDDGRWLLDLHLRLSTPVPHS